MLQRYSCAGMLFGILCLATGAHAQVVSVPAVPIDIEYSKSLDRLVIIAKNPNQLLILNPATGISSAVALPKEPSSLSVSPDGQYAAVGYDALVSYINLTTATVEKNLPVSVNVREVLLAGNGWVHAFPGRSINIASGVEWSFSRDNPAATPAIHPTQPWVYYTRGGSPDDLIKADISTGAFNYRYDSRYHGDFPICGKVWMTQDGQRVITACATLFRTAAQESDDIIYNGKFSATNTVQGAVHNPASKRIAVLPGYSFQYYAGPNNDTEIQFYEDQFLDFQGRVSLPEISAGVPWHGRYLFGDAGGTKLYVAMQPDARAGALATWGVYTLSVNSAATCSATLGATAASVPAPGGDTTVNVTATAGCVWQSSTAANWLFIGQGGVAAGNGAVTISASPNLQTSSRNGTVTIAGQTFTVTQTGAAVAGTDPTYTLPFRVSAAEYSRALDRIVAVSTAPNALHIFDPVNRTDIVVPLALPPTAVSVSPDGLFAAVGHDGWVSWVNLSTGTVLKNLAVAADVFRLALSATDVYVFPRRDQWQEIHILNLATAAETSWNSIYAGSAGGRISPDGKYLYLNDQKRVDISAGPPTQGADVYSSCYDTWLAEDGQRLFTNCGSIVRPASGGGQDLVYAGRLWEGSTVAAAHSSARKLVAAVQGSSAGSEDTKIQLFSDEYLAPQGSLPIPKQQMGTASVTMRGRYLFWNKAASRLFAIVQADASSGVLNDYSLYTLAMDSPCGVTFPSNSASAAAAGGTSTVSVTATAGCVWFASSSATWLSVTQNAAGSGNGTLTYSVDPNTVATARSATITVGGQTFTVTQAAGSPSEAGRANVLPFRVMDAEYSTALDRLIAVSDGSNSLNIYDPSTRSNTRVPLALPPTALALSPDGLRAAVGHDGFISIVNLQTATLEKNLPVTITVYDLALGSNNWVYASMRSGWGTGVSVNIATGQEQKQDLLYRGARFQIHPNGKAMYSTESGTYPENVHRFSIVSGPMTYQYRSPYHGDYSICGPLWFMADARLMTGCGTLFRTADTQSDDLKYAGSLSGVTGSIAGFSHTATRGTIAALSTTTTNSTQVSQLTLHDDQFLALRGRLTMPDFPAPGATVKSTGRFAFWNKVADRIYVVLQATSSPSLNDFALLTVAPQFNSGCNITLASNAVSVSAVGTETGSVAVTAGADCVWDSKSNVPWIVVTSGQFAAGLGTAGYRVEPNPTAAIRTGTITIGGQTLTVTQSAGDGSGCIAIPNATSLLIPSSGSSGILTFTVAGGCPWTAASSTSWVQLYPLTGTGPATISYTVYPNFSTSSRTAGITVAGRTITVTQSAATGTPNERFVGLMYFNCIGRLATPQEVAFHSNNLASLSRADTVMNFFNSEEFNRSGRFIAGLYLGILARDAEFAGWLFQRNALVTNITSQERLVPSFINSPEFNLKYGTLTDRAFVQLLYRNVLGREGSTAEVDFQTGIVQATSRAQLAQSFLNAAEFRIRNDKRMTSFLLYSVLLLRGISPEELAGRMAQMDNGTTVKSIVEGMLGSPEFMQLLQ